MVSKEAVEAVITPEFVNNLFEGMLLETGSGKWIITVQGKPVVVSGKLLYDSRKQAVQAFYNCFKWRSSRDLHMATHPGASVWDWWREGRNSYWSVFKKVMTEKYGLKIIQI